VGGTVRDAGRDARRGAANALNGIRPGGADGGRWGTPRQSLGQDG
jgi:hypothetical protein